ncbi:alkaline phosphatase D family protein [Flagellimonas sp. CMM7]|uniref:alkaline phosphatase D family protein n=1 Tax=Flagellimonas sp. CMM7 TaxID=2654676 RepID=UPI0013D17664|nr:alkaline phosphatase D family protein [Flagellimonas sp. CMM7]UII78965.1 alkaline phosphatase family protein [Flagellimonas sp. CMM7]
MQRFFLFLNIVIFALGCKNKSYSPPSTGLAQEDANTNFIVAFGSCNKQDVTNPFWDDITLQNPNVWIWGGDIVYANTDNMDELKAIYNKQGKNKGYQLLKSKVPVIGTWDDNDYGLNDGGEEFFMKRESQQLFLDFMEIPKDDKRRNREGVYASHTYKTPKGSIKILVLDTRYFRSQLLKDENLNRRYKVNYESDATVLGTEQWKWLENELSTSEADFNLIVSSIQFLSAEHGFETWGNFPKEVEKLNKLIMESKAKGAMILSGDRHISEFSKTTLENMEYPLIDFTSSGLTHSYSSYAGEPNRFRVGEVTSVPSFGIIELNMNNKEAHLKIMGENGMVFQELKQVY